MTSNLHYFKYHCNSLVYNTDICQYPIQKLKKTKTKTPLHYIYIYKNILKDKNIEEGLTWYRVSTQFPITTVITPKLTGIQQ